MCGEFNNISIFLWFKCSYDLILIYKWWLRSSDPCLRTNNIHMMASVSRRLIILCILCIKIKIMIQQKQFSPESLSGNICVFSVKLWLYFFTGIQDQSTSMTWYIFLDNSSVIFREFILACWSCCLIKVKTKLPNSEQSYKGKVQTHNYINRQNQSTTGKLWKP